MEAQVINIPSNSTLLLQDEDLLEKESFKSLIKKECELIKKHFTKDEKNKIIFEKIYGDSVQSCIYGLMVGNCNDERVTEFIINNLDTFCVDDIYTDEIETNYRSGYLLTPMEYYITPTSEEYDLGKNIDSYNERKKNVYKWLKD